MGQGVWLEVERVGKPGVQEGGCGSVVPEASAANWALRPHTPSCRLGGQTQNTVPCPWHVLPVASGALSPERWSSISLVQGSVPSM